MKLRHIALATIMLIVPVVSQAASKDSEKVSFDERVTVGGTQIPAGDYRVQWEGTGTSVEVNFIQAKKIVAKVPASLVEGKTTYDGAVALKKEGNTEIVKAINWKNRSLYFDQTDSSSSSTSANGASN